MKKTQEDAEKRVVKTATIKPVVPFSVGIIRKLHDDGSVVYQHPNSGEGQCIKTYDEDLHSVVHRPLEKLKALADLLDDEYWSRAGFIIESIINETEQQYEELFDHLEREVGRITVDTVMRGEIAYRTERIAGIRIEPPEAAGEVKP
jgi:hypothetical protein